MDRKIKIYKAHERGKTETSWLNSFHSFSFANYFDPENMGAGVLRVLNDDTIKPNSGFPAHSHQNMEIITIILKGKLTHKDSIVGGSNTETISLNEVQVMSAGTGVTHSEFNNEKDLDCELLQIWVTPNKLNLIPSYDQKIFREEERNNKWQIIVSPDLPQTLHISQGAYLSLLNLDGGEKINYKLFNKENGVFIFIIEGKISIEDNILNRRDAIFVENTAEFSLNSKENSSILAIEVPLLA